MQVNDFIQFAEKNSGVDFLFVDDGSTDRTKLILQDLSASNPTRFKYFILEVNSGKAEAVRQGILESAAQSDYTHLGYWDADLATPLSEIPHLLQAGDNKKLAIGSRMKRLGALVERKRSRHLFGRVFSTFASIILKLPVYDTQCGAKILTRDLVVHFTEPFMTQWLFDIEFLARYRNKSGVNNLLSNVVEVPLNEWIEKGESKIRLKHLLKVPFELWKINRKYN